MEEAEYMGMSIKEFEYMLRNERTFLKELLALGVGEEARVKIENRLRDIDDTISD